MATPSAMNGGKAALPDVDPGANVNGVGQRGSSESDLEKRSDDRTRAPAVDDDAILDEQGSDTAGEHDGPSSAKPTGGLTAVLGRVVSRTSTKSAPGPPPDGGMKAWITGMTICLSCSGLRT